MVKPLILSCAMALAAVTMLPQQLVSATEEHELRIGTLAPTGSSWDRIFKAFDNTLRERTGGKLKVHLYAGGTAGDERDVIRKMKVGQMDGAGLTSIGLGQIVRSVLVLQLPGMFQNPEQLAKVRKELSKDFEKEFETAGYVFLGWGDVGDRRILSTKKILTPKDYLTARPWVWRDDPLTGELMTIIGANGVLMGLPEVFPALQTGMVDTVVGSATAAVSLQWFRFIKYMSKSTGEPVVGASVVRKEWFDALPPDMQETLRETAAQAHQQLLDRIRKEDEHAGKTLVSRGIEEFDMMAQEAEWKPVLEKLWTRLTGKLYTRELLARVWKSARGTELPAASK